MTFDSTFHEFAGETLDCDDTYNELEDYGEISSITLPEDTNFVINSDEITTEKASEDSSVKKDVDEMSFE